MAIIISGYTEAMADDIEDAAWGALQLKAGGGAAASASRTARCSVATPQRRLFRRLHRFGQALPRSLKASSAKWPMCTYRDRSGSVRALYCADNSAPRVWVRNSPFACVCTKACHGHENDLFGRLPCCTPFVGCSWIGACSSSKSHVAQFVYG